MITARPLVTIVVPLYNAADTVSETIESLAKQTYSELEVIVIDDGSTDRGGEVAQRAIASGGVRMEYIRQANAGQAVALNNGWTKARGQFLGYLSADDILYPHAIENLVEFLLANQSVWAVYPDYDLIDANSKVIRNVHAPEFDAGDLIERSVCQPGPGALFRKEAFSRTGGWNSELRLTPDFDFWLRLSRHGDLARLPKTLAGFRVHESSQSFAPPSEAKSEEATKVIRTFFDNLGGESSGGRWNRDRAMAWAHVLSARLHLRAGRWRRFLSHLLSAMRSEAAIVVSLRFWHLLASGALGRLRYRLQSTTRKS